MSQWRLYSLVGASLLAACTLRAAWLGAQPALPQGSPAPGESDRAGLVEPVYRVAAATIISGEHPPPRIGNEHPLKPTIRVARQVLQYIDENIHDYSCLLVKRERVNGVLHDPEHIYAKIRHRPFSVYMNFVKPDSIRGREVLFVQGMNGGELLGHEGRGWRASFGTVSLKPDGPLAMQGQRYPITDVGLRNMLVKLIEVAEHDTAYGECEVQYYKNAVVRGGQEPRICACVEVTHPVPRDHFRFHIARVFFDVGLQLPIRCASYSWPKHKGGEPELIEEYTYLDVQLNQGFTNLDFDRSNPAYRF